MADGILDNLHLVNAPAGSGKTTTIRRMVSDYLRKKPENNIVCITYTNRAADELKKGIDNPQVFIGTIHSFLNHFLSPFFSMKEVIDLYFEVYESVISERIANISQKSNIIASNNRYIEKFGELTLATVKLNLDKISYGETPFTSYYYGMLSHDDLISFSRLMFDRFPIIRRKLTDKYQLAFIDEYQDTASSVLQIFFDAYVMKSDCALYLLGDRMQRIYDTYDGNFEENFAQMNSDFKLRVNHRSARAIIDILNRLYNDEEYNQFPEPTERFHPDYPPEVIITTDVNASIKKKIEAYPDALILRLLNKDRFYGASAIGLFNAVSTIEKYGYGKKYSVLDVMTTHDNTNPDTLFSLLFVLNTLYQYYIQSEIGSIVSFVRNNKSYLKTEWCILKQHSDKETVRSYLDILKAQLETEQTIRSVLVNLNNANILNESYIEDVLSDVIYDEVLEISIAEFNALVDYLSNPHVSTQHGVKGESHDTVVFVAEDSNSTPAVNMYKFYELWSTKDIKVDDFETFGFAYKRLFDSVIVQTKKTMSEMKKPDYDNNADFINAAIREFSQSYADNIYYNALLKNDFDTFLTRSNMSNLKKCLSSNKVLKVIIAYKLFYVGCSRSRRNLSVIIDQTKISSFEQPLREKLTTIGFNVREENI
ncbi:UvrD-helicase domain-containing protein [Bariatricus sp. HCP28S3_E4]|uniref:UvrD-helicase domain-containing protein n=1 Tax=unclassified Bariatricus TaxID=2677046 RepID=UPI003F8959BE